jgi:hypothetical protein
MPHVFLITASEELAACLIRYCKYIRGLEAVRITYPPESLSKERHSWVLKAFDQIADKIETVASASGNTCSLHRAVVFADPDQEQLTSIDQLNPISLKGGSWSALIAMLVLAFPEIHWVINDAEPPPELPFFGEAHTLSITNSAQRVLDLHDQGFTPLFDATGWRTLIRERIRKTEEAKKRVAPYTPVRLALAASLDEEDEYAYFNAYTAYRFGYRCHVLTTYAIAKKILDEGGLRQPGANAEEQGATAAGPVSKLLKNDLALAFEDLYINFPDKSPEVDIHFSELERRDGHFKKLQAVNQRIFVTVGHQRRGEDQQTWADNRSYLRYLKATGCYCKTIYKPESGVFDLWARSGLWQRHRANNGLAQEFEWPPKKLTYGDHAGGHSAPGRLLVIANRLLERSSRVLDEADSVPKAIHGAVLALDAIEYLGHRTPTTSLEALALKHQLEVFAECMFYGVEYNMDVESRFKEIESEVRSIGEWFRPTSRSLSMLNAEIRIISELILIFRQHNQFDEEQKALVRIRSLSRHLWYRRNKWWSWVFYPARWYVEFLLGSLMRFVLALIFWLIMLSLLYGLVFPSSAHYLQPNFFHGVSDAIISFFGLQPPHDLKQLVEENKPHVVWVMLAAIILGFVHLGIFISHLYSIIARR